VSAGRGVSTRRAVVVALVAVSATSVALGLRARPTATSRAVVVTPVSTTPLWSARRVPQPVVDAVGAQRLQAALAADTAGVERCFAVDADGAGPVAAGDVDRPLAPGSTAKLLTAAAVLATLGPGFHFETRAVSAVASRGEVVDRLWFVGGGDPLLATPDYADLLAAQAVTRGDAVTPLAALADGIVAKGVRRIPGGIQGDDARYDRTRYLPAWPASYRTEPAIGPIGALTVNGGFASWKGKKVPAADPAVNAATELTRLLVERGVQVGGTPGASSAPANAVPLATVVSPALSDVIAELLASSDNLSAEMLTRELGARAVNGAAPGTTATGLQAIATKLTELGLPLTGLVLDDGSGLSHTDRVTCRTLLAAVALGSRPELRALHDGLAIAGTRGTLADEFHGTPLEGKLLAKTGTLAGVSALAGLVDIGRPVRFAVLLNGDFADERGRVLRNRAATDAARFPDAPPADVAVPPPATSSPSGR